MSKSVSGLLQLISAFIRGRCAHLLSSHLGKSCSYRWLVILFTGNFEPSFEGGLLQAFSFLGGRANEPRHADLTSGVAGLVDRRVDRHAKLVAAEEKGAGLEPGSRRFQRVA